MSFLDRLRSRPQLPMTRDYPPAGRPIGLVLFVHGGGWPATTPGHLDALVPFASAFSTWGFHVRTVSLHAGAKGLSDVVTAIDVAGAHRPLVVFGESSGGHLALLAAAQRPAKVDGVITFAAPTTLEDLKPGELATAAGALTGDHARLSPLARAADITAPVFLVAADNDTVVPGEHTARFAHARDAAGLSTTVTVLPAGDHPWQHSDVDAAAVAAAAETMRAWLLNLARVPA